MAHAYKLFTEYYTYFVESENTTCINIPTVQSAFRKAREYSMVWGTVEIYGRDWETDLPRLIARAKNGRIYRLKERV